MAMPALTGASSSSGTAAPDLAIDGVEVKGKGKGKSKTKTKTKTKTDEEEQPKIKTALQEAKQAI